MTVEVRGPNSTDFYSYGMVRDGVGLFSCPPGDDSMPVCYAE